MDTRTTGKPSFFSAVYRIVQQIPRGRVATYGQIAMLAGNPRMSRQVGWALHQNPDEAHIPCHRVVNRFGGLAPSFVFGEGIGEQRRRLESEGIAVTPQDTVDLRIYQWHPGADEVSLALEEAPEKADGKIY